MLSVAGLLSKHALPHASGPDERYVTSYCRGLSHHQNVRRLLIPLSLYVTIKGPGTERLP